MSYFGMDKVLDVLHGAKLDIEQVGREIYYSMSYLEDNHPARANLNQALKILGVTKPKDVGLSSSVLIRRHHGENQSSKSSA